jgi:hypothetical protein
VHAAADAAEQRRVRLLTWIAVAVTLVPSIVLALHLVRAEVFGRQANRFVAALESESPDRVVLRRTVDASQRRITLTLLGEQVTPALQRELEARLAAFGLAGTQLELRRPGDPRHEAERAQREFAAFQQEQTEAQRRTLGQLEESRRRVAELEQALAEREAGASAARARHAKLAEEIRAQFPQARQVLVAINDAEAQERLLVVVDARPVLTPRDLARLRAWLAVRLGGTDGAAGTAFELVVGRTTA